jgi:hypothetical protein
LSLLPEELAEPDEPDEPAGLAESPDDPFAGLSEPEDELSDDEDELPEPFDEPAGTLPELRLSVR